MHDTGQRMTADSDDVRRLEARVDALERHIRTTDEFALRLSARVSELLDALTGRK